LNGLYDRNASFHGPGRNPIIVIPGILGSRLVDPATGRLVWGAFAGDFADPGTPEGARLAALPMVEGAPLAEIHDEVFAEGVLDRLKVSILGLPVELKAYLNILGTLGAGGYRDEELGLSAIDYGDDHFTCFQFPYDWRRDNVENARRLHEFIVAKKKYVKAEIRKRYGVENPDVKFDIVAHSMGGLLTRYLLRFGPEDLPADGSVPEVTWAGTEHIERVVLVGTPNAGSAEALLQLDQGIYFAPLLPRYGPAVLGTMPSIYQLLPRPRHRTIVLDGPNASSTSSTAESATVDLFDPEVWKRFGWGLASPTIDDQLQDLLPEAADAEARRRIALEHLEKSLARAQQFAAALDQKAKRPPGFDLHLFAGDAVATKARLRLDTATGKVEALDDGPGDGTVVRTSALLDERVGAEAWEPTLQTPIDWSGVTFLFADHIGLTQSAAFTDNVLFYLLEAPRN